MLRVRSRALSAHALLRLSNCPATIHEPLLIKLVQLLRLELFLEQNFSSPDLPHQLDSHEPLVIKLVQLLQLELFLEQRFSSPDLPHQLDSHEPLVMKLVQLLRLLLFPQQHFSSPAHTNQQDSSFPTFVYLIWSSGFLLLLRNLMWLTCQNLPSPLIMLQVPPLLPRDATRLNHAPPQHSQLLSFYH